MLEGMHKVNLIIDQGNTYCKAALFDNDIIITQLKEENAKLFRLKPEIEKYSVDRAIISSVSEVASVEKLLDELGVKATLFNHQSTLPIDIQYETPHTLGLDRIATAVGALKLSPQTNNLIIDIGTAITYDITTPDDGFIGGNIAPGLDMRLRAMHQQTKNLPLLERKESQNFFGKNTQEAMRNGAQFGIIAEIDSYISAACLKYGQITTFLTGGDAAYFEKKIKNDIFVVPNLIFVGLLEILKIN